DSQRHELGHSDRIERPLCPFFPFAEIGVELGEAVFLVVDVNTPLAVAGERLLTGKLDPECEALGVTLDRLAGIGTGEAKDNHPRQDADQAHHNQHL
ncbi:MAG: hypothetical protein VB949_11350, partial [Pseudomonadales bacterium]